MAEEGQKKITIGPKKTGPPTGSFVSREKVLGEIQEQQLDALERSQDDAKKAKSEEDEKKRVEAIDKLLPKDINASFGEVPYAIFKEKFQSVWDQIADKSHLARGFCTYTSEPAPNVEVSIRTLRSGEMKFLRRFTPNTDPMKDPSMYMEEDSLFRSVRFVLAVMAFDGNDLPEVEIPRSRMVSGEEVEAWLEDKQVKDRFNWLDVLPEELTDTIAGAFVDLSLAYRYALQENLKNQFAPPSHS